jgi:cytochrome d ubiquinol oxidase subunit II
VTMFTCFPLAFADIASNLSAPLSFALVGIVLRGAAFIFRNHAKVASHLAQTWTAVFGIASLLTPFWLGDSVGALATGRYAWLSPFALSVGLFALVACAQIAAVFLTDEVQDGPLRNDFRRRAIGATFALWIAGAIPALIARFAEPGLFAALVTPLAAIAITCAILLGLVVALALQRGARQFARIAVGAEALAILAGWFGAQAPALVPGRITLADAAASDAMLTAFLIAAAAGGVFLIPSLVLLFAVFKGPRSSA